MNTNRVMIYGAISTAIVRGDRPSIQQIADRLQLSPGTVSRSITALCEDGYIEAIQEKRGQKYEYRVIRPLPSWEHLWSMLFRFTPREVGIRIQEAQASKRVYDKAGVVSRMEADDPEFEALRRALWEEHPEIREISAVWTVETALGLEERLEELLDWEEARDGQASTVGQLSA